MKHQSYNVSKAFFCFISGVLLIPAMVFGQAKKETSYTFESKPVWSDEFDYTGKPDPKKWGYDLGGSGWGNNELQYYTDSESNAYVKDGKLFINAIREKKENKEYTSARLVTKNKGDFLYGRFEINAKLAQGLGTWPAIWMLPTDWAYGGWPKSGEIDIMEHVGYDPEMVHITIHCEAYNHVKGTQKAGKRIVSGAMTGFHKYRMDWTPDVMRGYIDDQLLFEIFNEGRGFETWPFDKRFHLLLNVAVGGNWGGAKGVDQSVFPATMEVDYVRVYKMKESKK